MMAFDMGGPLNKVAYASPPPAGRGGHRRPTPPSSRSWPRSCPPAWCRRSRWPWRPSYVRSCSPPRAGERQGRLVARASFITEGAIPFAAADPLRVIPSIMLGSAVTGALSRWRSASRVRAPHGGIFVLFAVHNIAGYLIALVAGVLVGAVAVMAAKTVWPANDEDIVPVG